MNHINMVQREGRLASTGSRQPTAAGGVEDGSFVLCVGDPGRLDLLAGGSGHKGP